LSCETISPSRSMIVLVSTPPPPYAENDPRLVEAARLLGELADDRDPRVRCHLHCLRLRRHRRGSLWPRGVDRTDRRLVEARRLLAEVADERCGDARGDFWQRSKAARGVAADMPWMDEQERLEAAGDDGARDRRGRREVPTSAEAELVGAGPRSVGRARREGAVV